MERRRGGPKVVDDFGRGDSELCEGRTRLWGRLSGGAMRGERAREGEGGEGGRRLFVK